MPLVRIDTLDGYDADRRAALADGVHRALLEAIGIPEHDRFQVVSGHAPGGLIFDAEYLGIARTERVVFVQITMSAGRTLEQKRALFRAIARNLSERPGVRPEDVFVNLVEVAKENWTFGNGIAQYAESREPVKSPLAPRQGRRLLQIGVVLLLFSAVEGFVIPSLPVPRLGLSVHTLSALEAVLTLALGLLWPRLVLGERSLRVAWWLYVYSAFATLLPYVLAAAWGAGSSIVPLAAGGARGTSSEEALIRWILMSSAPAVLVALALVLRGLSVAREDPPAG